MRQAFIFLWIWLATLWPMFASAEEVVNGGYRGIATLYYIVIWSILSFGLYDAFGKKALYVGAPILGLGIYLILPSA